MRGDSLAEREAESRPSHERPTCAKRLQMIEHEQTTKTSTHSRAIFSRRLRQRPMRASQCGAGRARSVPRAAAALLVRGLLLVPLPLYVVLEARLELGQLEAGQGQGYSY